MSDASDRDLSQVLTDWRGDAAVLRRRGSPDLADALERCASQVAESAEEWLTWLSEHDASIRAGRSVAWMRARFEQMRREGHARLTGRATRAYRACAVPRKANTITAAEKGRRAAQELRGAA